MKCVYLLSSISLSLCTSTPELSGFVQYIPLTLFPFAESGSPGIWFKDIPAKCGIPRLVSKPFIFKTSLHACFNLEILN